MAADSQVNWAERDDATLITMLVDGSLTRNRHYDFFSTERGKTVHKQAKTLQGVLHDLKNGAKIVSEGKDEWGWRIVLENEESRYRRTVIMTDIMYKIFHLQKKKKA